MSPEQCIHFKELLEKVNAEEKRAIEFSRKLQHQLEELIEKKAIDDYNFCCELHAYSSDEKVNKKFKVEEGDPIYTDFYRILDEENENINWKENYFTKDTFLDEFFFSYAMHCICWHSDLSVEEVLAISDVWIEIKIDYQFFTNKS